MTHFIEYNGVPFVEFGVGLATADSICYQVTVTKSIPGWSTSGTHKLKIFEKGNVLRGIYLDDKGHTGPLVFKRSKTHQ